MKLSDIIRNDKDRLFIVDTECFIIFTGGSITDNRPFIRIGTWSDLPVEIIPLVENIIITDKILGNPALEQFNIDIRNLTSNRYIGGESILKRFLDYQRNFGLDLTNVSVVNIEKDIPELPDKKNISDRDQFIGVFYSDGNVKIQHDGNDIFDLNNLYSENINIADILGRLSKNNKNTPRYSGSGFVVIDKNPMFYADGYFTSYQFPRNYIYDFSQLEIDPSKIRELLLPSQNIIPISDIMKLKHSREGKIRIFSDNRDQIDLIKKLFKSSTVQDETFSGMHYSTGNGMNVISSNQTPNIKIIFTADSKKNKDFTVLFLKSPAEIKTSLKDSSDAIIITYTAYEQSALLFKSYEKPVMILNDGNPNIRKIADAEHIVLSDGIQYDLKLYESVEELIKSLEIDKEIIDIIESGDPEKIRTTFDDIIQQNEFITFYNAYAMLKISANSTKDRKLYAVLRDSVQNYNRIANNKPDSLSGSTYTEIALCKNSCYQVLRRITRKSEEFYTDIYNPSVILNSFIDKDQAALCSKILEDRDRLAKILSLFYEDKKSLPTYGHMTSELNLLRDEIAARKEIYNSEFFSGEHVSNSNTVKESGMKKILGFGKNESSSSDQSGKKNYILSGIKSSIDKKGAAYTGKSGTRTEGTSGNFISRIITNITGKAESGTETAAQNYKTRNIAIIAGVIILIILIIIISAVQNSKKVQQNQPVLSETDLKDTVQNKNIVITVKRVDQEEKKLLEKHNVKITDMDIFRYANDVAVKNGYSSLDREVLKEKNPNWIYPANLFIMLDGEKVVVQKGDTLWDLSHAKLEKMNADFYKLIEQLEKTDKNDKKAIENLLKETEKYSYISQQRKYLENYKQQILTNE